MQEDVEGLEKLSALLQFARAQLWGVPWHVDDGPTQKIKTDLWDEDQPEFDAVGQQRILFGLEGKLLAKSWND